MDKEDAVHVDSGILSVIKEDKETPFAAAGMNLETATLSEVRQRKINMISHIWNLKKNNGIAESIYRLGMEEQM